MMWKVTVDFIEDGEENWETFEVDARTEEVALQMAIDKVEAMCDVEEIIEAFV